MFHNGLPSKVTGRQKRHTVVSLFSTPPSRLGKTHMLWRTCAWHLGFSPALAHATLFLTAFLSLLFLSLTHSQHTLTHNTLNILITHSLADSATCGPCSQERIEPTFQCVLCLTPMAASTAKTRFMTRLLCFSSFSHRIADITCKPKSGRASSKSTKLWNSSIVAMTSGASSST